MGMFVLLTRRGEGAVSPLLPPPVLSLNHGAALYKLQHHLLEAGGRCVPGKLKMVVSLAVQQPSRPRL